MEIKRNHILVAILLTGSIVTAATLTAGQARQGSRPRRRLTVQQLRTGRNGNTVPYRKLFTPAQSEQEYTGLPTSKPRGLKLSTLKTMPPATRRLRKQLRAWETKDGN